MIHLNHYCKQKTERSLENLFVLMFKLSTLYSSH